jgi:hypothetical protein
MILVELGNQAISRQTDENQFPNLEGLSQQFLVTNMQNVECASHRYRSISKLRL